MSYAEAATWAAYLRERGSLNSARRIDRRLELGFAMLAALMVNRTGGDQGRTVRAAEFMDAAAVVDGDEDLTPEVFMRIVQKGN